MVHVAREMKRRELKIPLLIGGATTSAKHTAVKIAPQYDHEVVHVLDASRSVGVVEKLCSQDGRKKFADENRQIAERIGCQLSGATGCTLAPYAEALCKTLQTDWESVDIAEPSFYRHEGLQDFPIDKIAEYIDWSPFFMSWELKGKYPKILTMRNMARKPASCSTMHSRCSSESLMKNASRHMASMAFGQRLASMMM